MDPSSPTEAPPPAYDAVQIEFDRKISDAVERSLQISEPPPPKVGEDGYEVWDDNTFEANERARQDANKVQSGSRPSDYHREKARLPEMDTAGATSSVENRSSGSKPHPPSSPPSKERPRWLADAQISGAPATPSGQGPGVSDLNLPSEDDYPDEELPPFTAVAPSLEGPPFEEVVRQPARYPASQTDSPPESPLDGVGGYESPPRFQNPPPRRHYDIRPQNVPVRPVTSRPPAPMRHPLPTSSRPPTMLFDPKIAYSRNHQFLATESELEGPVDAAALYKSAVSSLMKTQDSTTRRLPPIPQATEPSRFTGNLYGSSTYGNAQSHPAALHNLAPANQNPYFPPLTNPPAPLTSFSHSPPPPPPPAPFQQQYSQNNFGSFYSSIGPMPPPPPPNVQIPLPPPPGAMIPPNLNVPPPPPPSHWQPPPPPPNVYTGYGR